MNKMKRDLKYGEVIVLAEQYFRSDIKDIAERVVTVHGGFGMGKDTMGTALACHFLSDGERSRWEGYMISKKETEEMEALHQIVEWFK